MALVHVDKASPIKTHCVNQSIVIQKLSTNNMAARHFALLIFLLTLLCTTSEAKRSCLADCSIGGTIGQPLVILDGRCSKLVGGRCQVGVDLS